MNSIKHKTLPSGEWGRVIPFRRQMSVRNVRMQWAAVVGALGVVVIGVSLLRPIHVPPSAKNPPVPQFGPTLQNLGKSVSWADQAALQVVPGGHVIGVHGFRIFWTISVARGPRQWKIRVTKAHDRVAKIQLLP